MQNLRLSSFLLAAKINTFSEVITNRQGNLVFAITLTGPSAHYLGKDLKFKISDWQITNAQKLHLTLLDLVKDCRLKKLKINFALSLKNKQQLILACRGGNILLKRRQQIKNILNSQAEITMLTGQYRINDQLVLIAGKNNSVTNYLQNEINSWSKVELDKNLPKQLNKKSISAIAVFSYHAPEKINLNKKINNRKQKILLNIKKYSKKIQLFWQKIQNLSQKEKKRYKTIALLVIILILTSTITIILGRQQKRKNIANIQEKIQNILLDEAELAILSATQPVLAREKIAASQQALENLLQEKYSPSIKKIINLEIERVNEQTKSLASENNLDRLTVYSDWRTIYPEFLGQKIITSPHGIIVADYVNQKLLLIKNQNDLEIQDVAHQNFAIDNNSEELKIFLKQDGIKYLDWQTQTTTELKVEGDSDRASQLFNSYQNYLYLLNPEKRNIYRYTLRNGELSAAIGWLIDKQGINFANISDMSVDGNLWLTFKDGQIIKFNRGHQKDFTLYGLEETITGSLLISSKETVNKIIILDKNNRRLLIVTKDGQLISEIKSNELAGVSDIDLADDGLSCFALSGSVVYQIQL